MTVENNPPAELPHHRYITAAEAAVAEAEYKRRWREWLDANRDNNNVLWVAYEVHRAIWQSAYGAETISVRD